MKLKSFFSKIFIVLILLLPLSSFAQNLPIPQCLIDKIAYLQETLQSNNMPKFAAELGYVDIIKKSLSEQNETGQNEFLANAEYQLKEIFIHLQFDPESNSFKKICIEENEPDVITNKCISAFWDGKIFSTLIEWESVGFAEGNDEAFESAWKFFFEFNKEKGTLKLLDYGVAG